MPVFNSTHQFQEIFNLQHHKEYFDPILLTDRKVGFSVKRKYPENIRFKPALKKNGEPDDVALMWVKYTHPEETEQEIDPLRVPIVIRISKFSKYRAKNFDYNYEDEESPTKESVNRSESTPKPISLNFDNEFFYNHDEAKFFDEKGKELQAEDVLNRVFESHCNTIHHWKGLKIQAKLFSQAKGLGAISILISIITFLLKFLFGRTLDEKDMITEYYHGYESSQFKKLDQDSINIFSYKASKSVIIFFCFFVILLTIVAYFSDYSNGYIPFVTKNNTLTLIHTFFSLWLLDMLIPKLLFKIINLCIKIRTHVSSITFKHK